MQLEEEHPRTSYHPVNDSWPVPYMAGDTRCPYFLSDALPIILWVAYPDGRLDFCNDQWTQYTGLTSQTGQAGHWYEAVHPDDIEVCQRLWAEATQQGSVYECKLRLRRKDGIYCRHFSRAVPFREDGENVICWYGSCSLASEEQPLANGSADKCPEKSVLQETEARYRLVSANAPGMVYQFALHADGSCSFPFVSPGSRALFGLEPSEIENDVTTLLSLIAAEHQEAFQASVAQSAQTLERWIWAGWADIKSGERKWISCSSTPERLPNGEIIWDGLLMDTTEHKLAEIKIELQSKQLQEAILRLGEANQKLEMLASHDALTGLRNRRSFQERLYEEFQWRSRFGNTVSLLLIDVDHFKSYNDTYGHPAGDQVLQTVAHLVRESVRGIDVAARYGGEEFVVILSKADVTVTTLLAERIRCAIDSHPWIDRPITVSIGAATLAPTEEMTQEGLIEITDKALYLSKGTGRNRVTHASDIGLI
jgi:diguanylate cyclase (GGDEF)-like protein